MMESRSSTSSLDSNEPPLSPLTREALHALQSDEQDEEVPLHLLEKSKLCLYCFGAMEGVGAEFSLLPLFFLGPPLKLSFFFIIELMYIFLFIW